MTPSAAFLTGFDALPTGGYGATAFGSRWRVTKGAFGGARSEKLVAEELGGDRLYSVILYRLAGGVTMINPGDSAVEDIEAFLGAVEVD
ncbi:MAG: hypothetical protein HUJ27_15240 [Rhodobacteraceae bacterium]|nr:hypothetical protein [Paracoccaceae bacterium]